MISYNEDLIFSGFIFVFNLIISLIIFIYYFKKLIGVNRMLLTVFSILFYLYSGFGASFQIVPLYYSFMYVIFFICFLSTFFFIIDYRPFNPKKSKILFLEKYSKFFILIFILFSFLNAGYPDYNFSKLFIIEAPNFTIELSDAIEFNQGPIKKILTYLILIIQPFYLVSLIKLKNQPLRLFFSLFLPIYFLYTLGGYVARSFLIPYIAIYLFILYNYNAGLRGYIKYSTILSIPFLLIFLYQFSEVRIGHDINVSISFLDLFKILFFQEATYPILFTNIYNLTIDSKILIFFQWLITLPIPSFFKGTQFGLEINYYFTELLTGKTKFSSSLSIFLPGNVTEAYLIFGKYLFFLLPLIGGLILGYLYKILSSSSYFMVLRIYFIFMIIPLITRAGFNSAIPIAINGFLFFFIFLKFKIK